MKAFRDRRFVLAVVLGSLLLTACDVDVQEHGKDKNVDVRTAIGDVSVRTSEGGVETGLPVYPGATALRNEEEEPENADIKVATWIVDVHVAAARFESSDAPQMIVDFYRDKLSAHGMVVVCKGDIEFEGESGQPVCKEEAASPEIQLVAGTEDNHRIVAVKPRAGGSEFAVVSIQIGKSS